MVIINRALFLRALSRFEGTAPHVIQTLYVAPMIIASLIDLFCIQTHGRGPSDSPAFPLERDRLLDLLCGHVWPSLLEHFHLSIRITPGRTGRRTPCSTAARQCAGAAKDNAEVETRRATFHRHRQALRILAVRHFFISLLCGSRLSRHP
jgi:hypothetical protein